MTKYVIGLVDEDEADIEAIMRTIYRNKPDEVSEDQIGFKEYPLNGNIAELSSSLSSVVIKDLTAKAINSIIIDYQIIVSKDKIEGTDISKIVTENVPKFPVVILSNMPEECYKKAFVDADKVYSKRNFFKLEDAYSKEKTLNLFRNMDKYDANRAELSVKLREELAVLERDGYNESSIKLITSIERQLGEYFPQEQTEVEKALDPSDLYKAVELIERAKLMLEE